MTDAFAFSLPLPKRVASIVKERWKTAHPGLTFNKYVHTWDIAKTERKREFFEAFSEAYGVYPQPNLLAHVITRRQHFLEALQTEGYLVQTATLTTHWRLVSGLGMPHPFETGFVFDHTYGVPYLPGSSVKGAARAWVKGEGGWEPDVFQAVFGSDEDEAKAAEEQFQPTQGQVIFFDAYPTDPTAWPKLEVDILNVHYKEYYEGRKHKPPADWMAPVPIYFLTIAPEQAFRFAVAAKPTALDAAYLAKQAMEAIVGAANDLGLGGKTAVAYGYFRLQADP